MNLPDPGPHKGRTGVDRIVHATGYSLAGLRAALAHESAFRQELALAAVMLPTAFWLGRSWIEMTLLAGSVVLVLIVELLNSAIEAAIDRISLERHELAKRAKDYGSAAVMLALLLCGGVWAAALWQRLGA
jgi:diacylglycerol kinase (ATP)